ncbi:MAG: acetyltransferase [Chloroflexi bacterium]|nr:acetyltransferase [Chloroflexota bacterium]
MRTRPSVVIWGASGHALVVADILRLRDEYELAGFLDDVNPERRGEAFDGATILGGAEQLDRLRERGVECLLFGFGDGAARLRLAEAARGKGFRFPTAVHPRAVIAAGVPLGAGTVVAAGAVINPAAAIGEHVIVNTCASVDHGSQVGDGVHLAPGVRLAGWVTVGPGTWVGIGATVVDRVKIGAGCMIGAGAVVVGDIPDGVVAYGVPARIKRNHESSS